MRARFLALVALLCSRPALGLRCYICPKFRSDSNCTSVTCLPNFSTCYTATISMPGPDGKKSHTMENRGCAPSCEHISWSLPGPSFLMPTRMELQDSRCCQEAGAARSGALAGGLLLLRALL